MKKLVLLLVWCVLLCPLARSTSICTAGTLATYESLGAGGCTIGGDLFSSFANVSGTFGATELDPTLVAITPSGGASDPELIFSVSSSAAASELFETIFTYELSNSVFLQSAISLANSSETVDGAVTDIQNLCAGGTFGPDGVDGCTGNPLTLLTLDGIQNSDNTASGGIFTDAFTAQSSVVTTTPEPANTWPLGLLVALLLLGRQSQLRSKKS